MKCTNCGVEVDAVKHVSLTVEDGTPYAGDLCDQCREAVSNAVTQVLSTMKIIRTYAGNR